MCLLVRFRHKDSVCHHLGHGCVMPQQEAEAFSSGKNRSY